MDQVRKKLRVDYAYKNGITGRGVTVAVMDTGIMPHPDFGKRILAYKDFVYGKQRVYDDNGHGCHVAYLKHKIKNKIHKASKL